MTDHHPHRERTWARKFGDAFRGLKLGIRGQSSFFVHFFVAVLVVTAGLVMRIDSLAQWCLLLLCITVVLAAEMFNSAMESMARAVTLETDPHIRDALDIGSAAVLVASVGASAVGAAVFLSRLGTMLGWW